MIYGTLTQAQAYAAEGKLAQWLQDFLRSDGKNLALAEGLIEEDPRFIILREIPVSLLEDVEHGAPSYLHKPNDIQYFFEVVDRMRISLPAWDTPPLIVEYRSGKFAVNDGRHRLEMYRQLGIETVWAVMWIPQEEDPAQLVRLLDAAS